MAKAIILTPAVRTPPAWAWHTLAAVLLLLSLPALAQSIAEPAPPAPTPPSSSEPAVPPPAEPANPPATPAPASTPGTDQPGSVRRKLPVARPAPLVATRDIRGLRQVDFEINNGDVRVLPGPDSSHIRVSVEPPLKTDADTRESWIRRFDAKDGLVHLRLKLPKGDEERPSEVTLYVPAHIVLTVHVTNGDLLIQGIHGDKDLNVRVGNLTLVTEDPAEYALIDVKTRIGELSDNVTLAKATGLLGKGEKMKGEGKYKLKAHVWVGELNIQKTP